MNVYEIKTNSSDYPFLIIAKGYAKAVELLCANGITDSSIKSIVQLSAYKSGNILIEEQLVSKQEIKKKVYSELQNEMPHWNKMTNGAMGGGDREHFLIRSSKGHYFTSRSVGPDEVYLDLDKLENLSKPKGVE